VKVLRSVIDCVKYGDQYLGEERNSGAGREKKASGASEESEVKKETKRKDIEEMKSWRKGG
jgi:hypothetical protein